MFSLSICPGSSLLTPVESELTSTYSSYPYAMKAVTYLPNAPCITESSVFFDDVFFLRLALRFGVVEVTL